MNALSKDLRQRILNYALTHPVRQTAAIFQVSPDTVQRLKNLYYKTGDIVLPAVTYLEDCDCSGFSSQGFNQAFGLE